MGKIEWMDLKRQFNEYEDEFMGAVKRVCQDTAFSGGSYVEKFEKEFADYCNVKAVSGVNNGTSALFLGMKALGIGVGDEVIVPADTFIASAWGVSHNGATPVFVDIDEDTFEIDAKAIEDKITSKTKAIVGVHLYGQPFDVDAIKEIAERNHLMLIEDCAQAHGALYKGKRVGGFGSIGCFSFYPGKNLGAFGEAGAVISNDIDLIDKINLLRNHGSSTRYYHEVIGYNMRMEGMQGAVLSAKLSHLPKWTEKRQKIATKYHESICNSRIKMQSQSEWAQSVYHLFEIEVENRQEFIQHMQEHDISCGMHYPVPCHLQNAYADLGYSIGDLPKAEYHAQHCVSIPLYPELKTEEIEQVIKACNEY